MKVSTFNYENGQQVRVVEKEGSFWFVATDVCKILGLTTSNAIRSLDDSEKSRLPCFNKSLKRDVQLWLIDRSALFQLINTSYSPSKHNFAKWLYKEVLPAMENQAIEEDEETMDIKDLVILNDDDVPTTTSLLVAESFGKEHFHVMDAIRSLVNVLESNKLDASNFRLVTYQGGNGQDRPCYELDRNAYAQVVNGFTGTKATLFRKKYADAFDAMEEELSKPKDESQKITQKEGLLLAQTVLEFRDIIVERDEKIELDAPKVEAYDDFDSGEGDYSITNGLTLAGYKPRNAIDFFLEEGEYLYRNANGELTPYSQYFALEWFEMKPYQQMRGG